MEKLRQPEPEKEKVERIEQSAILVNDCIYTGKRHSDAISSAAEKTGMKPVRGEQGFVTNAGRFVSRKEAAKIAFEAGQTEKLEDELFSEDVW